MKTILYAAAVCFMATAAMAQKPKDMTTDEVVAKVEAAGYTSVSGCAQKHAGHGAWHCTAVPSTGGAAVPVVVDPKGRVHQGDVDDND